MTKSRAFVLEPFELSTRDAKRFGEIQYIFSRDGDRASIWDNEFGDDVERELRRQGFDPTRDFFVATGHMVPVTMAVIRIIRAFGRVRCLFWHSADKNYVLREFNGDERRTSAIVCEGPTAVRGAVPTS